MSSTAFIEGAAKGPDSKYLQVRCREGFHKLFAKGELQRMPALKACGGRANTFKSFSAAHANPTADGYVAMLLDSKKNAI